MRAAGVTLILALAVAAAGCSGGGAPPRDGYLRVGDPAPPLAVDRWLNGDPVTKLEPGKVYVLDFWATWCGPCIKAMPHLAKLQEQHAADGLVVIPMTTVTGSNTAAAIERYAAGKGAELGLRFAVCETRKMEDTWFEAAGQGGIPCSFLIDRQGKVAFIGHPMDLDEPLAAALAAK